MYVCIIIHSYMEKKTGIIKIYSDSVTTHPGQGPLITCMCISSQALGASRGTLLKYAT